MAPPPVTSISGPQRLSLWSGVGDRARGREEMPCSLSPLVAEQAKASWDAAFLQAQGAVLPRVLRAQWLLLDGVPLSWETS